MNPTVYFVIPCYNEEQVLPETVRRLTEKLDSMRAQGLAGDGSRMLLVDDGSKDRTWEIISRLNGENPYVEGVKLAHNRGHQNALLCGLMTAMESCDCAISLDADLQDDVDALDQFVQKYLEGCDVVYGVRNKRETDTWFKRTTAEGFYKVMKLLGVDIVFNHADWGTGIVKTSDEGQLPLLMAASGITGVILLAYCIYCFKEHRRRKKEA